MSQATTSSQSHKDNFVYNFFSGGLSGIIAKTVAAPAERVKLLLQTDSVNPKLKQPYKGVIDCLARTVREDGFWALWRGNWANVVRYFPTQALNFAFKDFYEKRMNPHDPIKDPKNFILGNILAGGFAGCTTNFFVYPLDLARTKLGIDIGTGEKRQYRGVWHVITSIYNSDGIKGLYRGMVPAVVGIFMYRGLYFGIYDSAKVLVLNKESSSVEKFFVAQGSVLLSEFISYPTDTVKRKLMADAGQSKDHQIGTWECSRKIWHQQGIKGFWRGYLSNILRSVGGSLSLVIYDQLQESQKKEGSH